ncbi:MULTISPECIES: hypothetical protein [Nocardia]|uniref:Small secreted domain DUF320 n=1 Tax=Nocardia salmonicida TaxID=53431 RepID=A0ABZ1MZV1_9NOCA|nr:MULTISPECIES: hypothetical protein [Nocardia]KQY31964.1 hypothetical protein ASD42_20135 [Nocardia sp. Root136]
MRNTLRIAAASVAVAGLVGAAAGTAVAAPSTGSSGADAGSAAANSAAVLAGQGDIIGLIVLLGVTPFQILTGGICDVATLTGSASPCTPGAKHY